MSRLTLKLLGPPRVELDGEPVQIGRRKALALLAYLAVTGRPHSRDSLAALLWPDYDQSGARAELRRTLSVLRKTVGDRWLAVDVDTAGLDLDADVRVDVARFQESLATCERHGHRAGEECDECGRLLEKAAELCEDDFLAGFTLRDSPGFDEWQLFEMEGLRDELGSVLERLARWERARGGHEAAIRYARRWVALDPLHEPAQRGLMEAYEGAGQRSAALRQYRECERTLQAGLGLPPSAETTALYERIHQAADVGRPVSVARSGLPPKRRHNLPAQPIPFVGRERELAEIGERLREPDCRLLTLIGPGGSGKTRLAIEAAAARADDFEDGVFFVSLAGLQSPDSIVPAIAQAIGLSFYAGGDPESQLLAYLGRRTTLLVLDNFEHLLPSAGRGEGDGSSLPTRLIDASPNVKLLVTSRVALRVQHEQLFPIPGMAYPEGDAVRPGAVGLEALDSSAVELFVQAACRVDPDFALSERNLHDVVRICRAVVGMPLGILLAAAWVRMLSPQEIADQLETGIDLLETDLRDVPERQRSMQAVFDHSWNLLTEKQQSVMEALSVFRSGFTWEAARVVADASLRELRTLVDRSLVQPAGGARYLIHELLRQYAAEGLARSPPAWGEARDRHAAYYATALEAWEADLKGSRQQAALLEMDTDSDNTRAAWDWAADRLKVDCLAQAMEALGLYYVLRSRVREGEVVFRRAIECLRKAHSLDPGASAVTLAVAARALGEQARLSFFLDRLVIACDLLDQGLALLQRPELANHDTRSDEAFLWYVLGTAQRGMGRAEYHKSLERSLELARSADDKWGMMTAVSYLAYVAGESGDYAEARQMNEACTALAQELGSVREAAVSNGWSGWLDVLEGQVDEGVELASEALSVLRKLANPLDVGMGLLILALALACNGRYAESQSIMEVRLALAIEPWGTNGHDLSRVGWIELERGRYAAARAHLRKALKLARGESEREARGLCQLELGRLAVHDREYGDAKKLLIESIRCLEITFRRDWVARAQAASSYAARGLGDREAAREHLVRALRWATGRGSYLALVETLPAAAWLLSEQGEVERAVEIYALACTLPAVANSVWYQDVVGRPIAEAAESLPPEVVTAAKERGRARDMNATLEELLAEWGD